MLVLSTLLLLINCTGALIWSFWDQLEGRIFQIVAIDGTNVIYFTDTFLLICLMLPLILIVILDCFFNIQAKLHGKIREKDGLNQLGVYAACFLLGMLIVFIDYADSELPFITSLGIFDIVMAIIAYTKIRDMYVKIGDRAGNLTT